ncbi:ATP-dependent RNA helicase HrpA [Lawsonella clevelandensis]|uniref:ATP-dependent RNA helicase HrpA n=1 Tax=Lawsonella clevelandensis TaxID=1528099 RepID=UPI0026EEA6D0|nr:ATP-dependent RNA helicase HrpA [Lawsonella clevelandensis]
MSRNRHRSQPRGPLPEDVRHRRNALYSRLGTGEKVTLRDYDQLRRRIQHVRSISSCEAIEQDLETAELKLQLRQETLPHISYPQELPISARINDIRDALLHHQVVIVAGETGSGKTTQLPKLCMELGWGTRGIIGHTQPRRIAARSVAERIADELHSSVGDLVGYSVRFTDAVSEDTLVKVMTDGILLAEIHHDRLLRAYDTIIIDEAHERSLNIDFLLGYLKQILPQRPDLHIIITSATIETERFAEHFAIDGKPAPIIEVSGRTYPVEIRYRPGTEDDDPLDVFVDAVTELYTESSVEGGDILAFFPGEREIREAEAALRKQQFPALDIVPLFGRLSAAEQHRVFEKHTTQRVVLATNVAETSLTVPGIRYVIDTGTARISRYSHRTKIQRLPIEEISQASARQRSGRCGRLSDGIALRLYSEENFEARPSYTEPEILRTNLAAVILRMADLGFGSVEDFPFLDPPELSSIRDGVQELRELGTLRDDMALTSTGRTMARIPTDPRLARMLIEAQRRGVLGDVMVIVAGLSLQDIRERPSEQQQEADQLHARFRNPHSDFLSYLQLWDYLHKQQKELSRSAFRRLCKKEFLHWMRYREWLDLVQQLTDICHELKWSWKSHQYEGGVNEDAIHRALLAGLLSHIGSRISDTRDYQGTRGKRFAIFPSSGVARKTSFLMAYEIVETSRVWARTVAAINPEWVEKAAGEMVSHRYAEPHWSHSRGEVQAYETTSLWGVPLVVERLISYRKIDPELSRKMFLLHGLVQGDWNRDYSFKAANDSTIEHLQAFEEKARQRGSVIDEETLAGLFAEVVPDTVMSRVQFDQWWKHASPKQRAALEFSEERIRTASSVGEDSSLYPDDLNGFFLDYSFKPGFDDDGISVLVPLTQLPSVRPEPFTWLVPGMREELVLTLLRGLPKDYRRMFIPLPDTAQDIMGVLQEDLTRDFASAFQEALHTVRGVTVPLPVITNAELPPHLTMRFVAINKREKAIDADRNLEALQRRQHHTSANAISSTFTGVEKGPFATWTEELGDIPQHVSHGNVTAFPALQRKNDGWYVHAFASAAAARSAQYTALITLLLEELPAARRQLFNGVPQSQKMALRSYPGGEEELRMDCHHCAVRDIVALAGTPPLTYSGFVALQQNAKNKVPSRERAIALLTVRVIEARLSVVRNLPEGDGIVNDIRDQVEWLTSPGFVTAHGATRLKDIPRYLQAAEERARKSILCNGQWEDPPSSSISAFYHVEDALWEKCGAPSPHDSVKVKHVRWLFEEFKVSTFAQQLGTRGKVSEKKLLKEIASLP